MHIISTKPYLISWLAALLLLVPGALFQHPLEIQLHDTYFVLTSLHVVLAGAILLFMAGTGYWLLHLNGKKLNANFTLLHLLFTIGSLLFFALPIVVVGRMDTQSARLLLLGAAVLLAGQVVYLINLFLALFRS